MENNTDEARQKAFDSARQAASAQVDGRLTEAVELYRSAGRGLFDIYKQETNPALKSSLRQEISDLIAKLQVVKAALPPAPSVSLETSLTTEIGPIIDPIRPLNCFSDIIGFEKAKEILKEKVVLPCRFPQLFTGIRRPWNPRLVLFHGPSGCGKTSLALACAGEASVQLFYLTPNDFLQLKEDQALLKLRSVFASVLQQTPAILCFEEVEKLLADESNRARMFMTEFLIQLQISQSVASLLPILLTSVRPWELPRAVFRRVEEMIYMPLPGFTLRRTKLREMLPSLASEEISELAAAAERCSLPEMLRTAIEEPGRTVSELVNALKHSERICSCETISLFQTFVAQMFPLH